jgi:hypothetical protein
MRLLVGVWGESPGASPSRSDIPWRPRGLCLGFASADANILQLTRIQFGQDATGSPRLPHQPQAMHQRVPGPCRRPRDGMVEKGCRMVGHFDPLEIMARIMDWRVESVKRIALITVII